MKNYYERYWEKMNVPRDYVYKVALIRKLVPKEKNLKVLDFGCGKAIFTADLLRVNPSLQITGVDVSKIAIVSARRKMPKQKFHAIVDGEKLPFEDSSFDFIMALDVLLCVYDTEFIFKELSRVLKPKGKLLITLPYYGLLKNIIVAFIGFDKVYNPRGPAIRFYTKKSLANEIGAVNLQLLTFGYFGRFFPVPRGMYAICRK